MADTADLLALFDAAAVVRCGLTIFESDEPQAHYALTLWASARHLTCTETENEGLNIHVTRCSLSHDPMHDITVHHADVRDGVTDADFHGARL